MNKELEESIVDLKNYIKNTPEYQKVIKLKKKMGKSSKLQKLIKEMKDAQKNYIRNEKDEKTLKALKNIEKKLNEIPIYREYNKNLEIINEKIYIIKEELNEYFDKKMNI